ncbi:unnamed protein product, partial [Staurois parvus]
ILICCVQWFCTEQPGSSFSWVPHRLSLPLPFVGCPTTSSFLWGHPLLRVSIHSLVAAQHSFMSSTYRWIQRGLR